jgi:hypothetical protein
MIQLDLGTHEIASILLIETCVRLAICSESFKLSEHIARRTHAENFRWR